MFEQQFTSSTFMMLLSVKEHLQKLMEEEKQKGIKVNTLFTNTKNNSIFKEPFFDKGVQEHLFKDDFFKAEFSKLNNKSVHFLGNGILVGG